MSKARKKAARGALYSDISRVLTKHAAHLSLEEMLAVASITVGSLISLQDRRMVDPAITRDWVLRHIDYGKSVGDTGGMLKDTAGSA